LLETSGYLSIWQIEQNKNPWQYDLALMRASAATQIEDYCWSVLANEDSGPNRYVVNRGGYLWVQMEVGLMSSLDGLLPGAPASRRHG
jgi:hypothetical protein